MLKLSPETIACLLEALKDDLGTQRLQIVTCITDKFTDRQKQAIFSFQAP
ncbi:MAG: hypothetical protein GY874_16495 [Desulfobacteraceae bacterium]|nr:hypothetical protein [Desulfobacteraceae bacterium]